MWIQMREPFSSDEPLLLTRSLDIIWWDIIFKSNWILTRMVTQWRRLPSRGRCRSWRRSTGTAPSSSCWGHPDSRARADSPSAPGASRWSSRWAAPARTASRSRGETGPGKSVGGSQLSKPTLPPTLAANYQTRTERCRPRSRWDWTSTPGSCRWRGSGVNLFCQQERFSIPELACCLCKFYHFVMN